MAEIIHFTDAGIRDLPTPKKRTFYRDDKEKGLVVQITPNGVKTYYLSKNFNGRGQRFLIGRAETTSVCEARVKANELLCSLNKGIDPKDEKRKKSSELRFKDVFEMYMSDKTDLRPRTIRDYNDMWKYKIKVPFGDTFNFSRIRYEKKLVSKIFKIIKTTVKNREKKDSSHQSHQKEIVILTPDSYYGSFGDQAMIATLISKIKSKYKNPHITLFNPYPAEFDDSLNVYFLKVDYYYPQKNLFEEFKTLISQCDELFVIGADILDGGYGEKVSLNYFNLIKEAFEQGVKISIQGFSFNNTKNSNIINGIKEISRYSTLKVRDPQSFQRLKRVGCKNLMLVADMAFLFNENLYLKSNRVKKIESRLIKIRQNEGKIIVLHLLMKKEEPYKNIISRILNVIKKQKNITILLLPHDTRTSDFSKYSDIEMNNILEQEMKILGIKCINASFLKNEIDVKYILNYVNLAITGRMHLAIAALSKNIPVISFIYQNKFEGLYDFYKFNKNLIFDKNSFEEQDLESSITYCLNTNLTDFISHANKNIKKLSEKNF